MRQVREKAGAGAGVGVRAGAGAEASSCSWLPEKEGEEVEEQAVTPQEEEPKTVVQPEQEPSKELKGLGSPVTWSKYKMKGLDHIRTSGLFYAQCPFSK